jgi:hypothetical protein
MISFMIALFAALVLYPSAMPFLWAIFLPIWMVLLWRLRCWNCGERLLRHGGSHVEMCKTGLLRWDMCRHKTCGAELH